MELWMLQHQLKNKSNVARPAGTVLYCTVHDRQKKASHHNNLTIKMLIDKE